MRLSNRKEWVDFLRAIAMLLVIYGHQVADWNDYFVFTSPVKICLFFALTGYLFNEKSFNDSSFFYSLLRHLIIPWLAIAYIPLALQIPWKGITWFLTTALNILLGKRLWYMPCCIIAEIIWYYTKKLFKNRLLPLVLVSAAFFGLGVLVPTINNIYALNAAFCAQLFLLIGEIFKRYEKKVCLYVRPYSMLLLIICYIALGVVTTILYPNKSMDVHVSYYYNVFICILMVLIGVFCLFIFGSKYLKHSHKVMSFWGRNTLVIYLLHAYCVEIIRKVLSIIHIDINRFTAILTTLVVCSILAFVSEALNKFLPRMMGTK